MTAMMAVPDLGTMEEIPDIRSVDEWLNGVSYENDLSYRPTSFAVEFVTFIKLVNGGQGEENKTPVLHLKMLDNIGQVDTSASKQIRIANMVFRGAAKTTLMGEYLFLYLGMYGELPNFGRIELALYVSDSIDNGVKNMRKNLQYRYDNSDFLKQYMTAEFTDVRWKFTNSDNRIFIVKGYGAKTGVRGSKEMGTRPRLAVLDDLLSDEDARSATVIASIEDTVYKAIDYALHPERNMIIWSGTPFNAKDPLYKAIESGVWRVNVYPVCDQFPCSREEFLGAWPDRFAYDYVKKKHSAAVLAGKLETFNQELMLRIMSDEDRLVQDGEIGWYKKDNVIKYKQNFNFYITTDFATSAKEAADFSVISVWAYNYNGDWFWVDGICKRQDMGANVEELFRLSAKWKPMGVGVEVSGQQEGFISWIQSQMIVKNVYFTLASDNNSTRPGIRPNSNKMQRFNTVVPLFKLGKMHFPIEEKGGSVMAEMLNEVSLASAGGFRSKKDDFIDTISMLSVLKPFAPTAEETQEHCGGIWEDEVYREPSVMANYIV